MISMRAFKLFETTKRLLYTHRWLTEKKYSYSKYYNKVTCALKCALPRKTGTYGSSIKCIPWNTRKCTHDGLVSE